MSLFVQVNSIEKKCPVIINMDHVVEIAPLTTGGCAIFLNSSNISHRERGSINVSDSYNLFKQFVMETVTSEQMDARIKQINRLNGGNMDDVKASDKPAPVKPVPVKSEAKKAKTEDASQGPTQG
jgi:hypothetical protein